MSKVVLIPEFDLEQLATGYMWVTKVDEKGPVRGLMPVADVADAMREFINWEASGRSVNMISRFENSPFLAWGQNGAKWKAVKVIEPGEYYLVSVSGTAYKVALPRLIVRVGSHSHTYLFWTDMEVSRLTPETPVYPLMIGNIDQRGWVCLGTSGLRCKSPGEIDQYIRQVIEVPATGTYLIKPSRLDRLYQALTRGWAPGIGRKHGIELKRLLIDEVQG